MKTSFNFSNLDIEALKELNAALAEVTTSSEEEVAKRRGRPPGSVNLPKKKPATPQHVEFVEELQSAMLEWETSSPILYDFEIIDLVRSMMAKHGL